MKRLSERLDTIGLLGRSIDDLALFRAALLGERDASFSPWTGPMRLGLCRTPYWMRADSEVRAAIEGAASALESDGIEVCEVAYPEGFGDAEELCWQVIGFEMSRELAWEYQRRPQTLSGWARASIEAGWQLPLERHEANLQRLICAEKAFDAVFEAVDVLLAPAAGEKAPLGLSDTGSPIFNLAFHIAGLPAVNLPCGVRSQGPPIGLQLIARRYAEKRLLDIAAAIEIRLRG